MRRFLFLSFLVIPLGMSSCRKANTAKVPSLPVARTEDPLTAPFVAGKRNRVYHTRHCRYAAALDSPVGFATFFDAESSGRIPCEFCAPNRPAPAPAVEKSATKP